MVSTIALQLRISKSKGNILVRVVAVLANKVKRTVTIMICGIGIGMIVQKCLHTLNAAILTSNVKWSVSILIFAVHVTAMTHKGRDHLGLKLTNSSTQNTLFEKIEM